MLTIIEDYNIRQCNTFRMNVKASRWIDYDSPSDLSQIRQIVADTKFRCIGAGSNMLFLCDYDGTLIHSSILELESESGHDDEVIVRAGAGICLDNLIKQMSQANLWGLENLSLIPGDVGSSVVQNVGAYGVEAGDLVKSVECFDMLTGNYTTFSTEECLFGYRDSMFKKLENRNRYVVIFVNFCLHSTPRPILKYGNLATVLHDIDRISPTDVREAIIAIRRRKLPDVESWGSAGSFFKNPVVTQECFESVKQIANDSEVPHYLMNGMVKIPAAWLIEHSGLKGTKLGGAGVWSQQPLVIYNRTGNATPDDIVNLANKIIDSVRYKYGITLSPEVDYIS